MKKLKGYKGIILVLNIVGVILACSITVYTYSYISSDIKYTKKDGTEISVGSALNELYARIKKNNSGIDLLSFNNEQISSSYNVSPITFGNSVESDGWYHSKASIDYEFETNSDFELSVDIFYINNNINEMGGPKIIFYNENAEVCHINLYDSWGSEIKNVIYADFNAQNLYSTTNTNSNCSGKYAIVKKNNKVYLYYDRSMLNSIDFNGNIKITDIEIIWRKYPNYSLTNSYIKNIYIGDILNYKDN